MLVRAAYTGHWFAHLSGMLCGSSQSLHTNELYFAISYTCFLPCHSHIVSHSHPSVGYLNNLRSLGNIAKIKQAANKTITEGWKISENTCGFLMLL
jgi:hypothetical protein